MFIFQEALSNFISSNYVLKYEVVSRKQGHASDFSEMYKVWKYFEKGQPHVCDYRMKQLEYTLYVSWEVHDVKNKLLVELWIIFIICSYRCFKLFILPNQDLNLLVCIEKVIKTIFFSCNCLWYWCCGSCVYGYVVSS